MSQPGFGSDDTPVDVATLTSDDRLLDALGRGEDVAGEDVALLLAAWRDDLALDIPTELRPALPPETDSDDDTAVVIPITRGRRRRLNRISRIAVSAAAGITIVGGLLIAAGNAGPDSPLWPITRVVYQDRADSRQAEQDAERVVGQARQAAIDGRYADASRLLTQADGLIAKVRDPAAQKRLRDEVDEIRRMIASAPGTGTPPAPGTTTTPDVTPAPGASAPGGGQPGGGPTGGAGATGGGGLVPGLPLPSLPLPPLLPSPGSGPLLPPLPSLLPSLPLPHL
jgi:type II secretory pathway pseudopilin PulG